MKTRCKCGKLATWRDRGATFLDPPDCCDDCVPRNAVPADRWVRDPFGFDDDSAFIAHDYPWGHWSENLTNAERVQLAPMEMYLAAKVFSHMRGLQ